MGSDISGAETHWRIESSAEQQRLTAATGDLELEKDKKIYVYC